MKPTVTLDQLIQAILPNAGSPEEIVATAIHMVSSGAVELVGATGGKEFNLERLAELDEYLLAA